MKAPPKVFTGDHSIVPALNRLRDNTIERTPIAGRGIKLDFEPTGFRIHSTATSDPGGGLIEQFIYIRQYKDYVVGKRWTANLASDARGVVGTIDTEEVRIAKPFEIRTSFWDYIARGGSLIGSVDGVRYAFSEPDGKEREATLEDASAFGAATITTQQEIYPKYIANHSLIKAQKLVQGSIMTVTETVNGTPQTFTVDYEELPGRVFMNKERKIRVCIEGSSGPWFALFRPSGAFQEE